MALKTVPFNVAFTFSRPDPADYEDINGDTQTAGTDVPRFNYSEGVGEGLILDASLSEIAAINDIPNFNSSSGTWVIKADLDKSKPIPGSGFSEFMEGSGTLVFVYGGGGGQCWADGEVLYTVHSFSAEEPGFLSDGGLAKIQGIEYYPYAWADEKAATESTGEFSIYFGPDLIFADGTDGFWGDSTDSSTLFQNDKGQRYAVDGDFLGLRVDKSKGSPGPDVIAGGDFSDPADWVLGNGATISGGALNLFSSGDFAQQSLAGKVSAGDLVLIRLTMSGGQLRVYAGQTSASSAVTVEGSGEFAIVVPMGGVVDYVRLFSITNIGFSVTDVTLRVYPAGTLRQRQFTTAQKPTLQVIGGVQALVLDDDDDNMGIAVPTGGWAGTFVQGTALGVIVGEIDVPAGPYQIPTDPNFAGPASDIHTVIVNRSLAAHELERLVEWVGQRCPVADFAGVTTMTDWFRSRTDLVALDVSGWDTSSVTSFGSFARDATGLTTLIITGGTGSPFSDSPCTDYTNAFTNTNLSQQSYTDIVTAIEAAGTISGTLDITGGTSTTTGAAQTAVDALRGRGWTVTTPDSY